MIRDAKGIVETVSFHQVSLTTKANTSPAFPSHSWLVTAVSAALVRIRVTDTDSELRNQIAPKFVYTVLELVEAHPDVASLHAGDSVIFDMDTVHRKILSDSIKLVSN